MAAFLRDIPGDVWLGRWRQANWIRALRMYVDGEPEQKGPRGRRAAVPFQQQVVEHMVAMRRRAFTGPLALDLQFRSTRKNPPAIYKIAKNVLDLLGAADEAVRPPRRSVLYRDDRQVKFLYVELHQAWGADREAAREWVAPNSVDVWEIGTAHDAESLKVPDGDDAPAEAGPHQRQPSEEAGSTYLAARPRRDVLAAFRLADRLRDHYDEMDESSPFWSPKHPDDFDEDAAFPFRYDEDSEWTWADRIIHYHHLVRSQEAVLGTTDSSLFGGLCMYLNGLKERVPSNAPQPYRGELEDLIETARVRNRRFLLSNPLTLPLPALPHADGEAKEFARTVREQLQRLKRQWPLLTPLLVPVKITFLVVPPEQGKDLDNIAREVLPIAHEVLKPHIEPYLLAPTPPEYEREPWRVEAFQRLRSLNANSVIAYQVIELPRSPQDPPEGVLRLALGPVTHRSWWEHAADFVEKKLERVDDLTDLDLDAW